jgi:hypothetical protein
MTHVIVLCSMVLVAMFIGFYVDIDRRGGKWPLVQALAATWLWLCPVTWLFFAWDVYSQAVDRSHAIYLIRLRWWEPSRGFPSKEEVEDWRKPDFLY